MATLYAALLGIIQGLTEFLPVSSSAHLILARAFFGWDLDQFGLPFDVACHVGTLIAVVIFYWADLMAMLRALPNLLSPAPGSPQRTIWLLIVGTVPAVIAGLLFSHAIEDRLRTPVVAATMLALGALGLLAAERFGRSGRSAVSMGMGEALILGVAQAAALVPGVSRSGATITAAMLLGLSRPEAAGFSFLLGVPAIMGAAAKEGLDLRHLAMPPGTAQLFVVGVISSAIVGYLTVRFLIRYLARHSLVPFAWYRLALSLAVVVWLFTRV